MDTDSGGGGLFCSYMGVSELCYRVVGEATVTPSAGLLGLDCKFIVLSR